ncbi:putative membrane protein (TIGR01666 family) [Pedobacter sp. CAN_A7]|uniref:FUSC family membrane protein n=1 Tax=Pedobacter sp. CAN_A7 TaxID=2787722 RepID=UPI0018C8EB65
MFHKPLRSIQDFLLGTYFAEGIRITIGVLCPSLILAQFGLLTLGMALSLGALCVSVVDSPGPIVHRRNAMIFTTVLIFVLSFLVGLTNQNLYFIGILLPLGCFIFSMFSVYGMRAGAIGTAALLVIVLSVDDVRPWQEVSLHAVLILAGGTWYTILSYFIYRLRPYRLAQQNLSESIYEVSSFLRAKATFYRENVDYDANYAKLLQLQVHVHEKQDAVREVLFKTREIIRDSTPEGRFLLLVFVDMVDLFEQIMSTYYNYRRLHEQFDSSGILKHYEIVINQIADELDNLAFALKTGGTPLLPKQLIAEVASLKSRITAFEADSEARKYNTLGILALKNIEVNIENILSRVVTINGYFNKKEKKNLVTGKIDTDKFISHQTIDFKLMLENLTFKSSIFRHSLRVAIVMFIGFVVSKALPFSHSYWILLTILVISKPGFSLTKQRNYHRIIGTVVGALVGVAVLTYIHDKNALFVVLLICMIGCYSFQRLNYVVSVLFMTPYILILFNFLGMGSLSMASERIIDTLIGSGIALFASYSLFPNWEHEKLKEAMMATLSANATYFKKVTQLYFENNENLTDYKLARKEVYVTSSNLTSLFQRMFSEPKSKQVLMKEMHQFTALNHLLSSYVATLSLYHKEHGMAFKDFQEFNPVINNTLYLINLSNDNLVTHKEEISNVPLIRLKTENNEPDGDGELVTELLSLIQKVAYDIYKLTERIKI